MRTNTKCFIVQGLQFPIFYYELSSNSVAKYSRSFVAELCASKPFEAIIILRRDCCISACVFTTGKSARKPIYYKLTPISRVCLRWWSVLMTDSVYEADSDVNPSYCQSRYIPKPETHTRAVSCLSHATTPPRISLVLNTCIHIIRRLRYIDALPFSY